jgi:tol-pal system protein YbgF
MLSKVSIAAEESKRITSISDRMERLEEDLSNLQSKIYKSPDKYSKIVATYDNKVLANLELRLSELEEKTRELIGSLEKSEFLNTQLNEKIEKLHKDFDLRINELTQTLKEDLEKQNNLHISKSHKQLDSKKEDIKFTAPVPLDTDNDLEEFILGNPPHEPLVEDEATRKEYNNAIALLKQNKNDLAEKALLKFIAKHDTNQLSGDAYYWLGVIYSTKKDYEKSALNFLSGYKKFPDNKKAPEGLLYLSEALIKLKKIKEACAIYGKIGKEYPNASEQIKQKALVDSNLIGCKK